MRMRFIVILAALLSQGASATWSILAVDQSTGRVVVSSATCLDRDDLFLRNLQAVVVPGKGVAACQADFDGTHTNQMLVFTELKKGTEPKVILKLLAEDPAYETRQYGIVDLTARSANHSGKKNKPLSSAAEGQVPGTKIFYSIQGNILRSAKVIPNAVKALVKHRGALTDRVMAALEAADLAGGDSRCTNRNSQIAYILMAESGDSDGNSHSNGKYALYLTVSQPGRGPNGIRPGEDLNPVKTLRARYDLWRKSQPSNYK